MESKSKKSIIIIGGGPAAMMLACTLDNEKFDITIVEKGKSIGRKFLVAGKGGFNLTHSENISEMAQKFEGPKSLFDALNTFTNEDLRQWLSDIGIETYIGSSKRVFPIKGIKPIEVLQAIILEMKRKDVKILTETLWSGSFIKNDTIELSQKGIVTKLKAHKVAFAMGGGSWKITGSDGNWVKYFRLAGVECKPFRPSNCVMKIDWSESINAHFGKPLKNISLRYKDKTIKGELMITKEGIEGSPAYALSYYVGESIGSEKQEIFVDLKPTTSIDKIIKILSSKKKITSILKTDLSLSVGAIALIKSKTSREDFADPKTLAAIIKNLPLQIKGLGELDEAISTVGGVSANAIGDTMELINFSNHFVIGEMLDWNAPTGGYLLQGCFSMGRRLGTLLNKD